MATDTKTGAKTGTCPEAARGGHETDCCYCPKRATVHVAYNSGCCNACTAHAHRIRTVKGGATFTPLSAVSR